MKGATVEVEFKGNTSDVEKKTKGLSKTLKGIGQVGATALTSIGSAAGTLLIKTVAEATKAHGELEQQVGGTEAVFKEFAKTVQTDASKAFSKMGLSANDYMATMNKMGSLMKGSGIDTQKAMDLSSQAMQRAADVASVMGIDVKDAMNAIAGAAKGNFTMMDNLGVAMNATNLQAYALSKGITTAYKDMEQAEKVELAMQMFMEKSADAAGNYERENKTLAGSVNTLKSSLQNLLSGAGTVEDVLSSLKDFVMVLVQNLVQILPQATQALIELLNGLIPIISQNLPVLINQLLPMLIDGVVQLTIGILEALPDIVKMIVDVLPDLMTMICDAIPELVPALITAIIGTLPALIKGILTFKTLGIKLVGAIVKGVIFGVAQLLKSVWDLMQQAFSKLREAVSGKSPLEIGLMLVKGLWNGIKNAKDWVLSKIKGFGKSVLKGLKKIFGISSPSKEFAIIGKYNVMGLEEGMRKQSLKLQSGFEDMFSLSPNLYGTSSTNLSPQVNVVNNINFKQDPLGRVVSDIKTFSGGAKNDYSYGMGA